MGIIGSAFVGFTRVYGAGEDRFNVPVSNGLVSLYNPAYTSSAINGYDSGTIVDLWGSKDLETAGDPVNVESDGAIYFYTGSYASSSAELSADLLGASAEFTVIIYSYQTISGSTDVPYSGGRFKIGGAGRDNTTNIIAELANDNYPVSIGATSASFAATSMYYPIRYNNSGGQQNVRYAKSNYLVSPPYPENIASSSFAAYSKADQNASYTKPDTNLSVYLDTFFQGNVYAEEQKTTIGIATIGDTSNGDLYVFDSADGNIPDVLETYITESFLILNPTFTSGGAQYAEPNSFALKGFAVYDRVLTTAEIQSMKSWFDESY